jgi:hypothetical protein
MIEGMNLLRSHTVKQQQNQQGGISDNTYETNPRMYATNEADCPVQALRKYLSKRIPTTDHFVQLSVQTINDVILHGTPPDLFGEKMLNKMMKNI